MDIQYKDFILNNFDNVDFTQIKVPIITVYDHPADYPKMLVARIWDMNKPTNVIVMNENINILRALIPKNMTMFQPAQKDDPCIKEIWL